MLPVSPVAQPNLPLSGAGATGSLLFRAITTRSPGARGGPQVPHTEQECLVAVIGGHTAMGTAWGSHRLVHPLDKYRPMHLEKNLFLWPLGPHFGGMGMAVAFCCTEPARFIFLLGVPQSCDWGWRHGCSASLQPPLNTLLVT